MWRRRPGDDRNNDDGTDSFGGSSSRNRQQLVGDCLGGDSVERRDNEHGSRIVGGNRVVCRAVGGNLIVRGAAGCHQRGGE